MIDRPSPGLTAPDGAALTWVGVNFWSRAGGPRMWSDAFDEAVVRDELRVLADHGLNVTRSFFYLPDFMPDPYTIDEACAGRYARFLDLSREAGVGTIPTFVVGHMSGENWDVAWRQGRDLYGDGWMLARQAFFARSMAERFGSHPAVAGWLLSNEMPLYGGPTTAEYARSWTELLVQAVRAGGAAQPVSTGDGALRPLIEDARPVRYAELTGDPTPAGPVTKGSYLGVPLREFALEFGLVIDNTVYVGIDVTVPYRVE